MELTSGGIGLHPVNFTIAKGACPLQIANSGQAPDTPAMTANELKSSERFGAERAEVAYCL